jgi:hypothetical protein
LCLKTKPITSFQKRERVFGGEETLTIDLEQIRRKGWTPEGFHGVPGIKLKRNEGHFDLTISEIKWLYSIIQEDSLHRRMFSCYEDLT